MRRVGRRVRRSEEHRQRLPVGGIDLGLKAKPWAPGLHRRRVTGEHQSTRNDGVRLTVGQHIEVGRVLGFARDAVRQPTQ